MTYDQLCQRCRRIMGFSPEASESPLECMRFLKNFDHGGRGLAAEMLARELAEFIEAHQAFYRASAAK